MNITKNKFNSFGKSSSYPYIKGLVLNTQSLLVEILVEELPALPFLKEFPNIAKKWQSAAEKYELSSVPKVFYTPRRIVIYDASFALRTQDKKEEFFGPPLAIAYEGGNRENALSKAGESFCKKTGASAEEIQIVSKDNKEVLYFAREIKGSDSKDVLVKIILEFLQSLNFGKSMRWGDVKESFIRPIRNICILFGSQNFKMSAYGINAIQASKIHTDKSFAYQEVKSIPEYFEVLEKGGVILSQDERRNKILQELQDLQKQKGIEIQIDSDLLEEIVAITEYPRALYGEFDEKFLELPEEVIITSMKENQRYFAIYKDGKLFNGFIVVSNSLATNTNKIISGNQKVLKARLSDAMFFYHNDLKNGLNPARLSEVSFVEGLGSLAEKTQREKKIATYLIHRYESCLDMAQDEALKLMDRAVELSKADLLTEMVYEFPELQGLMGYYYAKAQKEDKHIFEALKEQYLPIGENSSLPMSVFSAILAMSNKLDSIFGLFSIGKIPSGSKDPFALRRASVGVLKIILEYKLVFDLSSDIEKIFNIVGYKPLNTSLIRDFFIERLEGIVEVNPSIFRSVLSSKESKVEAIVSKARALNTFFANSDKEAFVSTFKRVANITKDISIAKDINPDLFIQPEEINLYKAYKELNQKQFKNIDEEIATLFSLKPFLDIFFDKILVNDSDEAKRDNRKSLIFNIYKKFLQVGDIKEITF